jgi:flagellar hook protein FlgE
MGNNHLNSGRNFLPKAIIASFLLVLSASTPADAGPQPLTNGILNLTNIVSIPGGYPWNVSIDGPGYFIVRDPAYGVLSATRFGNLNLDADGYLITDMGQHVQGFVDSTLTVIGDVQIKWTNLDVGFQIQSNGYIVASSPNGASNVLGQILLQNFQNPSALIAQGWQCYGWSAEAGPLPQQVPPGTSETGWLVQGTLEQLVPKLQISSNTGPPQYFSQGVLISTGFSTDIGVEGEGFFVLRRTNDNALFATRAGAFYIDGSGYFVHYSGLRLEGYTDCTNTSIGDVQIDPVWSSSSRDPGAYVTDFTIDRHGVITENLSDGSSIARGQILLEGCANPNLIARTNYDLYPLATDSGLWSPMAPPLSGNLGWLVAGTLEVSQFDTNLLATRSNLNFFSQGFVMGTDIPSNLAIMGLGFFTVRDPVANTLYATRLGDFRLDTGGHLVTTNGLRVQGFTNGVGQIGDIIIQPGYTNYYIDQQGDILTSQTNWPEISLGQVLVQNYENLQGLIPAGNDMYTNLEAAVPMVTNQFSGDLPYEIQSGAVEQAPPPPLPLQLPPPPGGFRLFISDLWGGNVESSTDLVHWSFLGSVAGSPDLNVAEFFDTTQTTQRFYRIATQDF